MRETTSIFKNHLTGEEIKTNKLTDSSTIGIATVELMDTDNNLISSTKSYNYYNDGRITPSLLMKQHSNYLNNSMYTQAAGGYYGRNNIVFTDSTIEPNEKEGCVIGEMVAYCPEKDTNAGSDIKRCSYNPTESFVKIVDKADDKGVMKKYRQYRYVYDFNTSQGNGTINSIWWAPNSNSSRTLFNRMPFKDTNMSNVTLTIGNPYDLMFLRNGKLFDNRTKKLCTNTIAAINGYEDGKWIDINVDQHQYENESCIFKNGKYVKFEASNFVPGTNPTMSLSFKIMNPDNSIFKNFNYDLNGDTVGEPLKAMFKSSISSSKSMKYSSMIAIDNLLYVSFSMYSGSGSSSIFPLITDDGISPTEKFYYGCGLDVIDANTGEIIRKFSDMNNPLAKMFYNSNRDINLSKIDLYENHIILSDSTNLYRFNTLNILNATSINNLCYFKEVVQLSLQSTSVGNSCGLLSNKYRIVINAANTGSSSTGPTWRLTGPTAHTKLPAPIVKTTANNMKVTYDIYIECVNEFAEEGKEHIFD